METSFNRFYRISKRKPEFTVNGVGVREPMLKGIVDRPGGTGDSLLMFFYDDIAVNLEKNKKNIPAGSMIYWEKCGHYYGRTDKNWMHTWIHFDGPEATRIIRRAGLRPFQVISPPMVSVERLLIQIDREMSRMIPDMVIVRNLFEVFIREIVRAGADGTVQIPMRMEEIRLYIENNYRKSIPLEKLARKFSISKPHLSAEFKRWFGLPPGEYQIEKRLREAEILLMDNNLQIADVADRVGWDDVCHFSKIFKKHRGKSPSAVRHRPG